MLNLSGKVFRGGVLTLIALMVIVTSGVCATETVSSGQRHIAVVVNHQDVPFEAVLAGFRSTLILRENHLVLDMVHLTMDEQQQDRTIADLQAQRPTLILALGSVSLQAVSRQIQDIPIIFGLVLGDKQPLPDNVTGVFLDFSLETQFNWLGKILPKAENIGVIYNPEQNGEKIAAATDLAARLGLQLDAHAITSPRELPAALENLARSADVFWGINDQLVVTPQTARTLLLFSFRNRIPFIGLSEVWVKAGALFALDRDYQDIGRQCAELAEKILSGSQVRDLTPETPREVKYILNRHTAEQMKLELPAGLLQGAAKVY